MLVRSLTLLIALVFGAYAYSAFAEDKAPAQEQIKDYTQELGNSKGATPVPELKVTEIKPQKADGLATEPPSSTSNGFDPMKYTLGPDDVVEVTVMRHPEFSGDFTLNQEGKIQFKFVGDLDVTGLTKKQVEDKVASSLSGFINNPEVNVSIKEYRSKYILVIGDVGTPGRYYIRAEKIPVADAIVAAGLPTQSAAMRKCQVITPGPNGSKQIRHVDIYSILYYGNMKQNIDMRPGDILYVPSTVMAKVLRVINPVASTIGVASSGPSNAGSAKTAVKTIAQ